MSLSTLVSLAVPAVGGLGFCSWVMPDLWRRPSSSPTLALDAIVADAPLDLRTAVLMVADRAQTARMFTALGLGSEQSGFPVLESWDYDAFGLHADVLMLGWHKLDDWANEGMRAQLANYLGVQRVSVTSPAPGWVRLQVRVNDTLAAAATMPTTVHNGVDLEAVPIGVREDGQPWLLKVMYRQTLIAGASDSGKGSVLWSIIAGLGPAVKTGHVDLWVADPKGGMEFGRGEDRLWKRFHYSVDGILMMLAEAVAAMAERAARFKAAKIRKFTPSIEEPLNVLIIDEYAAMSAFATPKQVDEGQRLIGLLLTQGRAVGWSVIAAVQDPSKDTMPNRQYFMTRIGLHLDEQGQTAMVHGQGAKDRGALCHEIPTSTPGVAYVGVDGSTEFVRVRAFWIRDEDADAIVDAYSPAPEITGPTEDYSGFDPDDLGDEIPGDEGFDGSAVAA